MSPDFQVFSSLRFDPALRHVSGGSISGGASWNSVNVSPLYMLDFHRDRMLRAATHWGWDAAVANLSGDDGLRRLESLILQNIPEDGPGFPQKVKVTVQEDGTMGVDISRVAEVDLSALYPKYLPRPGTLPSIDDHQVPPRSPEYKVVIADARTTRSEYTHFKTTKRDVYDRARRRADISLPDKKEVLLVNDTDGSIMEGSTTTPYFWRNGIWVTSRVSQKYNPTSGSGGQDGTSRRWALERSETPAGEKMVSF